LSEAHPALVRNINALIKDTRRAPFRGLGKPEPLKGPLQGWWSRRITGEHRLVYRVTGNGDAQALEIAQCRYHY
jgi:toxin YoeB